MSTEKNATQRGKASNNKTKELQTEAPISEKDEVKAAEQRTNNASKEQKDNKKDK